MRVLTVSSIPSNMILDMRIDMMWWCCVTNFRVPEVVSQIDKFSARSGLGSMKISREAFSVNY